MFPVTSVSFVWLIYQYADPAEALIPEVIFVSVESGGVLGSSESLVAV